MKQFYSSTLSLLLFLCFSLYGQAQQKQTSQYLGKKDLLLQELKGVSQQAASRSQKPFQLKLADGSQFEAKINFSESDKNSVRLAGNIPAIPSSSFHLAINADTLYGSIILHETNKAFQYYSTRQGDAFVKEVDINKILCIGLEQGPVKAQQSQGQMQAAAISAAMLNLQSLPGGAGCLLLDFDGHYVSGTPWNGGNPINAAPSGMSDADIQEHWEVVAEDFRPFNLNVTTNEAVFNSYPKNRRMRCIITPTNTAAPGAGGVAYLGSFNWNDDTPCWTFILSGKSGGEASSHELGHTFNLLHDGRTNPAEGYFAGHGNWAPIMGVGYYRPISQWSRGEYNYANEKQDDLATIASSTYGVGYRADDHGNTMGTARPLAVSASGEVLGNQNQGTIERTSDVDFFSFTTGGGNISLNVPTVSRHGNLDILLRLYTQSGAQIGTFNQAGLHATLTANLSPGTYYVSVDGTGAGNPATDGYSDYASLGSYGIYGNIPPAAVQGVAIMYKDCSYGGTAVGLNVGDYTLSQLNSRGIMNDDISSLRVNSGYEVLLYEHDNFSGASITITADNSCLVGVSWNDRASSLRVRTSGITNLSGTYHLQNRNSGLYLDVAGPSTADGANLIQWNYTGAGNQQFEFTHLGGGIYRLTPKHSGKSLEVSNGSTANGGNVQQWSYAGFAHQQFIVQATGDGFYRILSRHSGKLVEVAGFSTAAGANVQQWDNVNQASGHWRLVPVAPPAFSTTIQAENYSAMAGVQTETTTDAGGGLNVGWIEAGDWMAYNSITIPSSGNYTIEYRVASPSGSQLSLDLNAGAIQLGTVNIPATGGWQNWTTVSHTVNINAGTYNFGIYAPAGGWNFNWFRITRQAATQTTANANATEQVLQQDRKVVLYPNPTTADLFLKDAESFQGGEILIYNSLGKTVYKAGFTQEKINVSSLLPGLYVVILQKDGQKVTERFIKQ